MVYTVYPEGHGRRQPGGQREDVMSFKVCSLFSGSSGNSTYIGTDRTHILVDAGVSMKNIIAGLKQIDVEGGDLTGILVTHEHSDHIIGAGAISRKFNVP